MSRAPLALVPPLLLLLACGSEPSAIPDAGTPDDGGGVVDAAPSALVPVSTISASNDLAEHVRVAWARPSAEVTGYRVRRDGVELRSLGADATSFDDTTAEPASLAAPRANASVGTVRSGIEVSWEPLTQGGAGTSRAYSVVALYGDRTAAPPPNARGSRAGVVTGFEVTRADGKSFRVAAGARKFEDVDAPKAQIALPAPTVSVDAPRSIVNLALPNLPTVTAPASASYRVRALGGPVLGAYSAPVEGRRGAGAPNEVDLQWQRSASTTASAFADLPGVTGLAWFDSSAPSTEQRHFRARTASPWADDAVSAAGVAKNVTWQAVATEPTDTCGVNQDGQLSCWWREGLLVEPTVARYDRVVVGSYDRRHCARRLGDHKVDCWSAGAPSYAPDVAVTHLAAANDFDCAIRELDHKITCWRPSGPDMAIVPTGGAYRAVAAGTGIVCGLNEATSLIDCFHQGGVGPTLPGGPFRFVAVNRISPDVCGLGALDGQPSCYQSSISLPVADYSELAIDSGTIYGIRSADGALVSSYGKLSRAGEVYHGLTTSGASDPCAIDARGHIRCWSGGRGLPRPILPEGTFSSFVDDYAGTACGIRKSDGKLDCLSMDNAPPPTLEISAEAFRAVAERNYFGLVGIEATSGALRYVSQVSASGPSLPTGAYKAVTGECALRASDGKIACWTEYTPAPPASSFDEIATNPTSGCGIRSSDKKIECWGAPLGPRPLPIDAVEHLGLGCAIRAVDHKAVCWRSDSAAEPLADELVAVSDGSPVCGIRRDDHTVVCADTPRFETRERFVSWHVSGCGLRENDGKLVCRNGHVPIATR